MGVPDTGDTAWMLVCAALVLLMTPGLAFFYGGLVRKKNILGTMTQVFMAAVVVSALWFALGYALAFASGNRGLPSADVDADVPLTIPVQMLANNYITALFDAVVEATEEAIVNALCAAETLAGANGTAYALPLGRLQELASSS